MTDEDRKLLNELNRLGDALGPFAGGILTDSLSAIEQLDFSYKLISLAGAIRARVEQKTPSNRPREIGGSAL